MTSATSPKFWKISSENISRTILSSKSILILEIYDELRQHSGSDIIYIHICVHINIYMK